MTKQMFTLVNMRLPLGDDRTARARIRDEALRLFAERGTDAVTMRDIAAAATVSPALLVRHYGSKDGLVAAVDDHVVTVLEVVIAAITRQPDGVSPAAVPALLEALGAHLPSDSPVPAYLSRLLAGSSPVGSAVFARLFEISRSGLDAMVEAGVAAPGQDTAVRSAVLLANDLAMLTLRPRLTEVLGFDPLSTDGMKRWAAEVFTIYSDGLGSADEPAEDVRG